MTREIAERHYAEHEGKPFYEELVTFITSGPLVAMVLEGEQAVVAARQVIGATDPLQATTGSIRGDYAIEVGQNMVHGSDSPESAAREVALFFPDLAEPGRDRRSVSRVVLASRSPAAAGDPRADRGRVRGRGARRRGARRPARRTRSRSRTRSARPRAVALGRAPATRSSSGVDTLVSLGARSVRQAGRREEARAMLSALAGRRHTVVSGMCLIEDGALADGRGEHAWSSSGRSTSRCIDWYLASGEWRERAGGYAIQGRGAALVAGIEGDFLNVVGLPVATLLELAPGLPQRMSGCHNPR